MNKTRCAALVLGALWLLASYAAAWRCSAEADIAPIQAGNVPVLLLMEREAEAPDEPCGGLFLRPLASAAGERPGLAAKVIAEVNRERAKRGLNALRESAELDRAAALRARELVRSFSHTRPDGTRWTTVSRSALGENIARGHRTADRVMAAWMSSSGHRVNILRPGFGSVGVCAYIHNGITYWVQLFGR